MISRKVKVQFIYHLAHAIQIQQIQRDTTGYNGQRYIKLYLASTSNIAEQVLLKRIQRGWVSIAIYEFMIWRSSSLYFFGGLYKMNLFLIVNMSVKICEYSYYITLSSSYIYIPHSKNSRSIRYGRAPTQ